jgi:TonB-dependent SusC/RagA subfamily outer membrane receptor
VATVDASQAVERSAVENLTEILQAKTPGLTLMPGSGTVGTSANFRLRGAGSLYAGNTPTMYLDGVRVSTRTQGSFDTFGQVTSALDAINPADIESIEVIKGPAAATLYGAEAAAGVIQIITKKGRPGRIRWRTRAETGNTEWDENLRPVNYAVATAARLADTVTWPGFKGKTLGDIISFRPMSDGRHHRGERWCGSVELLRVGFARQARGRVLQQLRQSPIGARQLFVRAVEYAELQRERRLEQ